MATELLVQNRVARSFVILDNLLEWETPLAWTQAMHIVAS